MTRPCLLIATIVVFLMHCQVFAQSEDLPKFEVAAEFTTLERDHFRGKRTEPGLGGRFTFNLNRVVSLETAGYFFPKKCFECLENGWVTEVLAGVKVGKRFEKWGIFAKARPGFVSFSRADFELVPAGNFSFEVNRKPVTSFAADFGGVLEFYPSKRIVTRFDAGDTIIHFTRRTTNIFIFDPVTNSFSSVPFIRPARTTHNFQFMASVGFRF